MACFNIIELLKEMGLKGRFEVITTKWIGGTKKEDNLDELLPQIKDPLPPPSSPICDVMESLKDFLSLKHGWLEVL